MKPIVETNRVQKIRKMFHSIHRYWVTLDELPTWALSTISLLSFLIATTLSIFGESIKDFVFHHNPRDIKQLLLVYDHGIELYMSLVYNSLCATFIVVLFALSGYFSAVTGKIILDRINGKPKKSRRVRIIREKYWKHNNKILIDRTQLKTKS